MQPLTLFGFTRHTPAGLRPRSAIDIGANHSDDDLRFAPLS